MVQDVSKMAPIIAYFYTICQIFIYLTYKKYQFCFEL